MAEHPGASGAVSDRLFGESVEGYGDGRLTSEVEKLFWSKRYTPPSAVYSAKNRFFKALCTICHVLNLINSRCFLLKNKGPFNGKSPFSKAQSLRAAGETVPMGLYSECEPRCDQLQKSEDASPAVKLERLRCSGAVPGVANFPVKRPNPRRRRYSFAASLVRSRRGICEKTNCIVRAESARILHGVFKRRREPIFTGDTALPNRQPGR